MLLEFEPIAAVRAFVERGGDVLILIAAVTFLMWTVMLERLWYFKVLELAFIHIRRCRRNERPNSRADSAPDITNDVR